MKMCIVRKGKYFEIKRWAMKRTRKNNQWLLRSKKSRQFLNALSKRCTARQQDELETVTPFLISSDSFLWLLYSDSQKLWLFKSASFLNIPTKEQKTRMKEGAKREKVQSGIKRIATEWEVGMGYKRRTKKWKRLTENHNSAAPPSLFNSFPSFRFVLHVYSLSGEQARGSTSRFLKNRALKKRFRKKI